MSVALLLLNVSGWRVVTVRHACENSYNYYLPSSALEAIQKSLVQDRQGGQDSRHTLGRASRSARDLESLKNTDQAPPVVIRPAVAIAIAADKDSSRTLQAWKLSMDDRPIPPPLLLSKK